MSFSVSIVPNDQEGMGPRSGPMKEVHLQVSEILEADYVASVQSLSNARPRCLNISKHAAVLSFLFTGLATIASFAEGHYQTGYLSFIAGCSGVLAMVSTKLTYFANSQSLYHEGALRNLLTSGYQFLQKFVVNPNSIPLQPRPNLPDFDNIIQPAAITITPPQSNMGSRVRAITNPVQELQVPPTQQQPQPTQVVLQVIPQLQQVPPSADVLPSADVPSQSHKAPETSLTAPATSSTAPRSS
jgi:hypothetical protein